MQYENLTRFNDEQFKRLVGVSGPLLLQQIELAKKKISKTLLFMLKDKFSLTFKHLNHHRT